MPGFIEVWARMLGWNVHSSNSFVIFWECIWSFCLLFRFEYSFWRLQKLVSFPWTFSVNFSCFITDFLCLAIIIIINNLSTNGGGSAATWLVANFPAAFHELRKCLLELGFCSFISWVEVRGVGAGGKRRCEVSWLAFGYWLWRFGRRGFGSGLLRIFGKLIRSSRRRFIN